MIDAELVQAFRAGDALAFDRLYERHSTPLRAFAWRICGDAVTADDLCAEAWLKAWQYLPKSPMYATSDRYDNLFGYLVLLVKQEWWYINERLRAKAQHYPFDPDLHSRVGYVENVVLEREVVSEVDTLISYLAPADQAVVRWKVLGDLDLEGTAQVLGVSRSSARAAWSRSFRAFKLWKGDKTGLPALDQALYMARYPKRPKDAALCCAPGCGWPSHAHNRCAYHVKGFLKQAQRRAQNATA